MATQMLSSAKMEFFLEELGSCWSLFLDFRQKRDLVWDSAKPKKEDKITESLPTKNRKLPILHTTTSHLLGVEIGEFGDVSLHLEINLILKYPVDIGT